jgi:hypothetical protein
MLKKNQFYFPIIIILLTGCQFLPNNSISNQAPTTVENTIESTSTPLATVSTPTPFIPLGERFKLDKYQLSIPENWFYSIVNEPNLIGWVFTSKDPLQITEEGLNHWAGALWTVSPLPENSNPEAMRAEMESLLPQFGNDDLEGLLTAPERAGLLDLSEAQVRLERASTTTWASQPALQLDGQILFNNDPNLSLSVSVYLIWNQTNFLGYFQFSDSTITGQIQPIFAASRESLVIP